ncbi:MAG: 30S ribosomal protein S4e [Methanobacteriota archaeon]
MAKKGGGRHVKRYAASRALKLSRKTLMWTMKPAAGPHPVDSSIPLRLLVRDYLSMARTAREADGAIYKGAVLVDGKVRRSPDFPVGFMDVVSFPSLNSSYRVLLDHKGRLVLTETDSSEASFKLCKVVRKQNIKGKKTQLTLHDSKNLTGELLDYKPGDVVKLSLPEQKVVERIPFEAGSIVIVTGGRNVSKVGKISEIKLISGTQPNIITIENEGTTFQAPEHYIFVLGKEKPAINLSVSK